MPAAIQEWKEHQQFSSARDNLFNVKLTAAAPVEEEAHSVESSPPRLQCDTVGAVALDSNGAVAAATSTGGITNKRDGQVHDNTTSRLHKCLSVGKPRCYLAASTDFLRS